MCGIAGRFHHSGLPLDPLWVEHADRALYHRGPDGNGLYSDEYCQLVHRRLALIDLSSTGAQPMANEDGNILVIFNGEIYNHQNLRTDLLAKGHAFRGTSDTEVLVHLYEESGASMTSRLHGMFAFALYDRRRRSLLLARDRFGIKPLYYALINGQCVFASEIKAILQVEGFRPTVDHQACYDFLGLSYVPEPATAFSEIKALPKGSTLELNSQGLRQTAFHHIQSEPQTQLDLADAVDSISDRLLQAIKGQMVADVPVAALLSGGIDSSLVVAAYCRVAEDSPRTFNVRFPEADYDETAMAHSVSRHCQTRHQTIDLRDWQTPPELILQLLEHFDQPFADSSLIPMHLVSKAIREQGIICALSGDGGDEAFGGYARFWRANRLVQLMTLPDWLKRTAAFSGDQLARLTPDLGRQAAKAIRLAQTGESNSAALISGLSNYLTEKQKAELFPIGSLSELKPVVRHFSGYEPRGTRVLEELSRRMTENLFSISLPSDMLRKVDMMSMLASIEVRVPMLDESVVSLGLTLPHRLKTDGTKGKLVLRGLAERWLPKEVAEHRKHGFGIPLDSMVNSRFHEMLADLLLAPQSRIRPLVNRPVVEEWLTLFKQAPHGRRARTISREGLYQRIFIMLAMEVWLRKHALTW
jgi:asparagine synthase (glutamine-hydrolysing)